MPKASGKRTYFAASSAPDREQARGDLREVAECVRALLASSAEPATLGRLYKMHKDIQAQMRETAADPSKPDFEI